MQRLGEVTNQIVRRIRAQRQLFVHITPKPDACDHDWSGPLMPLGWYDNGRAKGYASTCAKCGMDAQAHSLRTGE